MHPRLATLALALPAALALVVGVRPARAATTPPGVNLRWDKCYDDGGALNKTFACDTNSGSEQLVLSFVLDAAIPQVTGQLMVVDLTTTGPALPAWWSFANPGSCRMTSLSIAAGVPAGSVNCSDWGGGLELTVLGAYDPGVLGPATARIKALTAVPAANVVTLSPGIEYVAAAIRMDHAKSVGLGSCSGCSEPVCIVFRSLEVEAVNSTADQLLQQGANGVDSQFVHWQEAQIQNLQLNCFPGHPCELTYSCVHSVVTPTRAPTWGAVKALYR